MTDRPIHEIPLDPDDSDLSFLRGIPSPPADPWRSEGDSTAFRLGDHGVASAGAMPLQTAPSDAAPPSGAPLTHSAPPPVDGRLDAVPPPARPELHVPAATVHAIDVPELAVSAPAAHTAPPTAAPVTAFLAPPPAVPPLTDMPAPAETTATLAAPGHVAVPGPVAPAAAPPPAAAAPAAVAPPLAAPVDAAPLSASTHPAPPVAPVAPVETSRSHVAQEGANEILDVLHQLVRIGGSDLHVSKDAPPMIRVDGGLRPAQGSEIWTADRVARALSSVASPAQLAIFEEHRELDFAFALTEQSRFRVNFYQQRGTIGAAFRLIPTEIKKLDALGVPTVVSKFATLPRGLVLVTGPTGSGKSTTLAALIDLVNETRADHIMTVEDPIEFVHGNKRSLVNQREVGGDTHSFQAALKHVLRQDPDVILIGELRDLETISTALTAAETGHLVFATLHTQDAGQTIDRIIDVFPPFQQGQVRQQLAATLQGVVCQTLVKRASGSGRAVATEVLVATPAIANLIREGKTYQIGSAMQAGRGMGMYTMDQHLSELVNAGTITMAAATEKAHDLDTLQRLVSRRDGAAFDPMADYLQAEASGGHS